MSAALEELKALLQQRRVLDQRISDVEQIVLAETAVASVGDTIEWKRGTGTMRGVVIKYKAWAGDVSYIARMRKKNGALGDVHQVYPYMNPKLISASASGD